ncbi:hypothetical protein ACFLR2_01805 [Chlamydiota bacterium]
MKTIPLENFSFLQELSLAELVGWNIGGPGRILLQYSFNLHTPLKIDPSAHFTIQAIDADIPPSAPNCCFSMTELIRWRLDISSYRSFDSYLGAMKRWHRSNYKNAQKHFFSAGCETSFIEGDWSEHAERVNQLYTNVARRYQHRLYTLPFFQEIAKHPDYKLLCAWFQGEMIGVIVLEEEMTTLHSLLCGLDYHHSSTSYAYSWMHYVLFEHVIGLQKYHNVDVGFSSDAAKKTIGFSPILSRMDIYSKGQITRKALEFFSRYVSATVTSDGKVKFGRA